MRLAAARFTHPLPIIIFSFLTVTYFLVFANSFSSPFASGPRQFRDRTLPALCSIENLAHSNRDAIHKGLLLMAKRRGNPNWGKPEPIMLGVSVTSFEAQVKSLGLSPHQYVDSVPLKEWVARNKDNKYVPLNLLDAWGFKALSEV